MTTGSTLASASIRLFTWLTTPLASTPSAACIGGSTLAEQAGPNSASTIREPSTAAWTTATCSLHRRSLTASSKCSCEQRGGHRQRSLCSCLGKAPRAAEVGEGPTAPRPRGLGHTGTRRTSFPARPPGCRRGESTSAAAAGGILAPLGRAGLPRGREGATPARLESPALPWAIGDGEERRKSAFFGGGGKCSCWQTLGTEL
eukprot:scaffold1024_cov200-Pinguiococcus_pyrenoidosus.AAC.1